MYYQRNADGEVAPVFEAESKEIKSRNSYLFALHTRICQQWARLFMQSGAYTYNDYNITCTQWQLMKFGRNPRREYLKCLLGSSYDLAGMETLNLKALLGVDYDLYNNERMRLIKKVTLLDIYKMLRYNHLDWNWGIGSMVLTFGNLGRAAIHISRSLKALKNK
jgi:hypothetical protein